MQAAVGSRVMLATGTYDVRSHPRTQVIVDGLRATGWSVDEVVEPLLLTTAQRVDVLRRPVLLPRLGLAILRSWRRLIPRLRRRLRTGPRPDAVLVGYLGHFDVRLVRHLVRGVPVVLDFLISGASTAADRGESGGLKQRALRWVDERALAAADVILVDTVEHAEALAPTHRDRAVVVPVGADHRWFAAADRAERPDQDGAAGGAVDQRLSVVFFGLFTPLQGTQVIARALSELDGLVDATVIGTGQDEAAVDTVLERVPGVTRLSWVDSDDLPDLVARHDVCLGIFGTGDKARRVVPNKAYQGAAAGCLVVTSDTPPQRRALGDDAVYVAPGDAAGLAAALRSLVHDRNRVHAMTERSARHARDSFSPTGVVRPLVAAIEGLR